MELAKKPSIVNGYKLGTSAFAKFVEGREDIYLSPRYGLMGDMWLVQTLEGPLYAYVSSNDWVIQGVRGELYPIKEDILLETYTCIDLIRCLRCYSFLDLREYATEPEKLLCAVCKT